MSKIIKNFEKIPLKALLCVFLVCALISVFALRHNNQRMISLRDQVYAADKDNGDVNAALNNLRRYVTGHMNTSLDRGSTIRPPIQLKYTYQRLYAAQSNQLQADSQKVYADAQNYCKATGQTGFDTDCIQNYVVNHGGQSPDVTIPAGLNQFDFLSPSWSPDFAGWSLVITILAGLALLLRLALSVFRK
jgi:hypothetical protein